MTVQNKCRMGNSFAHAVAILFCSALYAAPENIREVIPARPLDRLVHRETMQTIYEQIRTPYKYGVILKGEEGKKIDCPSVFRHGRMWYMMYIIFDGIVYHFYCAVGDQGQVLALATSKDLRK